MSLRQLPRVAIAAWGAFGILATAVIGGLWLGLPIALLFMSGAALVGVIFLLWGSVQSLTGETPLTVEEAISMGAPSVEEERKRAVLRALKDLDYERAVGKVSEEDYQQLSARYRREAKELLQALDEALAPARARAEERLARRLEEERQPTRRSAKRRKKRAKTPETKAPEDTPVESKIEGGLGPNTDRIPCTSCGAGNEVDARFCKGCGANLAGESEP